MTQQSIDNLAVAELERHKGDMLYAERQLIKAGDYETVARNLRRRKYVLLCVSIAAAVGFIAMGSWVWALFIAGGAAYEHTHARRTHETIVRWQNLASEEAARDEQSA